MLHANPNLSSVMQQQPTDLLLSCNKDYTISTFSMQDSSLRQQAKAAQLGARHADSRLVL